MNSRFLLAISAVVSLLASCVPAETPRGGSRVVTDDLGRTVKLNGPVHRVVTLAPSLTELVYAAGSGHLLAGVSTSDDYPPDVARLPRFSAYPLNLEAIAMMNPDLVLAVNPVNSIRHQPGFDALGIPVFYFTYPTLEAVWSSLERIGELLGTADQATAAADSLRRVVDRLRPSGDETSDTLRVLALLDDRTLYSFGRESFVSDLVARAGARSITDRIPGEAVVLTEEFVLDADPDVIVGAFGLSYDPSRLLSLHPGWSALSAIQSGRVCIVDPDWLLRPGPRLSLGLAALSQCLAPPASGVTQRNP